MLGYALKRKADEQEHGPEMSKGDVNTCPVPHSDPLATDLGHQEERPENSNESCTTLEDTATLPPHKKQRLASALETNESTSLMTMTEPAVQESLQESVSTETISLSSPCIVQSNPVMNEPGSRDEPIETVQQGPLDENDQMTTDTMDIKQLLKTMTSNEDDEISRIKRTLLHRMEKGASIPSLLQHQHKTLSTLLERTFAEKQSNSILLLGPRSSGKTRVLNATMDELMEKYPNANPYIIKLNGMVQTSDNLALKEIAVQLSLEHDMMNQRLGSFAEYFAFMLNKLHSEKDLVRPVIFILEEFDLFAQHPKQALLYNLFDVVQSSPNAIAVVASTCRIDSLDLLEKRVKSRFSQRFLCFSHPASVESVMDVLRENLSLSSQDVDGTISYRKFNSRLEDILENEKFQDRIADVVALNRDLAYILSICKFPIYRLGKKSPYLKLENFMEAFDSQSTDQKVRLMLDISLLELCLLISMKKLSERECESYTFEMIFEEYQKFVRSALVQGRLRELKFVKSVVMKAFESLVHLELVHYVEGFGHCPPPFRMVRTTVHPSRIVQAVQKRDDCPDIIIKWAGEF